MRKTEKHTSPIELGAPGGEISKRELDEVIRRFKYLNRVKLERVQEFLHPSQRVFLQLLPLLFHTNHPAIPGYVSAATPAGVSGYTPSMQTLNVMAGLSKSFVIKRRAALKYQIQGIYLMGSVGSIAYSKKSDLDFWICHPDNLSDDQLAELETKAALIEKWAETLHLEAHFFFINTQRFRDGHGSELSDDSCGDTQHHLLLEEFYRSGLYLAGETPLWWLVPPEREYEYNDYVDHLESRRFIEAFPSINFGSLQSVPAREFIGATLWHFYKAIESPHKSLLKLMLMEAYASEFPQPYWVSLQLKQSVYEGNIHPDQIDPYIMMYRKVETYLQARGEPHRLELARQSFYFKINEMLSNDFAHPKAVQRRELLASLTSAWNWNREKLTELDNRANWPVQAILDQQQQLVEELKQSYHEINQFTRRFSDPHEAENQDILLLGRKLQANLDRRPGKLEIFSDSAEHIQVRLAIRRVEGANGAVGWSIYPPLQASEKSPPRPLKTTRNLTELLAWAVANRICNKRTSFSMAGLPLTRDELARTVIALEKYLFQQPLRNQPISVYASPARLLSCALFISPAENDGSVIQRDGGGHMTSSRFDPLSFGSNRNNLITHIDLLLVSNWGEVSVKQFTGETALIKAFCHILNESTPESVTSNHFVCHSVASGHGQSLTIRVTSIWQRLASLFAGKQTQTAPRYILRLRHGYILLQQKNSLNAFVQLSDDADLMQELRRPCEKFSPVVFDHLVFNDSPVPAIYARNQPAKIQIFLFEQRQGTDLYILDERGSLYRQHHDTTDYQQLLAPYGMFLQSVLQHAALGVYSPVEYFTITRNSAGHYDTQLLEYTSPDATGGILGIRIMAEETASMEIAYTVHCDRRVFSSLDYGEQLFHRVASYISLWRRSRENYPMYVTDIDVPASILGAETLSQLQATHYLNYKRKIEARLNMTP